MGNGIGVFGNINLNTKIYRIVPRDRFFELYQDGANALVSPGLWDDSFENVILKARAVTAVGEFGEFRFHEDVYGQCWALQTASDAIRVRTTVGKLLESLRQQSSEWANTSCFIGSVEYLRQEQLREFGRSIFRNGINSTLIARSLLAVPRQHSIDRLFA